MASDPLRIVVYGQPAPQGSKRAIVNRHTGKPALVESSKQGVTSWRQAVVDVARPIAEARKAGGQWPFGGPVTVTAVFSFRRPQSHYGTGRNARTLKASAPHRPHRPPDLSKLARSTEDALTDAGIWFDDARVVEYARLAKVWCGEDPDALDVPGAVITIREVT